MCLTNEGNIGSVEKLCGFHGTCVQNICICDDGWSNSFEFMPTLFTNEGARELYNNISNFGQKELRLSEFKRELLNRSPCSRHDNTMYTLYAASLVVCCIAVVANLHHLSVTKKREEGAAPFLLTFLLFIFAASIKIISLDNVFPFNFVFSFSSLLFAFAHGIFNNIFFLKYTRYHLIKSKLNFGLEIKICGKSAEGIFKFQAKILLTLHILVYTLSFGFPVFSVLYLKFQENFNFEVLVIAQKIFLLSIFYALFRFIYIFILSYVTFSELAKDYFKLSNISNNTDIDEITKKRQEELVQLTKKILTLRNRILFANSFWFSFFFVYAFFPSTQVSYQYFIVVQVGISWPILSIFAVNSIPKCIKTKNIYNKRLNGNSKQPVQRVLISKGSIEISL
eukprot:snap_masked-scaffold_8-processed-gene-10.14-mRNA-1 protein AED:1.00 eAED:1.00 QI:0/0/0/0/1/1/2/0/394